MDQEKQRPFPIKTKIAATLIKVIGTLCVILSITGIISYLLGYLFGMGKGTIFFALIALSVNIPIFLFPFPSADIFYIFVPFHDIFWFVYIGGVGIISLKTSRLLFGKEKLGWRFYMISFMVIVLIASLSHTYDYITTPPIYREYLSPFPPTFSFIALGIPFILLFLDRKNFFKIAD